MWSSIIFRYWQQKRLTDVLYCKCSYIYVCLYPRMRNSSSSGRCGAAGCKMSLLQTCWELRDRVYPRHFALLTIRSKLRYGRWPRQTGSRLKRSMWTKVFCSENRSRSRPMHIFSSRRSTACRFGMSMKVIAFPVTNSRNASSSSGTSQPSWG